MIITFIRCFSSASKAVINMESLSALRMKYNDKSQLLLEENLKVKDPIKIFRDWLELALNTKEIIEPNAACLATVNKDGQPSNRFVLLKECSLDGFTFFTNYGSRKAKDIEHNPNVAVTIYWYQLKRSVRIEGVAEKIPQSESLKYFHERPRPSQIAALASEQSTAVPSRQYLDQMEEKYISTLANDAEVPMPNWGGYLIRPRLIEFWQGQMNRLHDRIVFRRHVDSEEIDNNLVHKGDNGWVYQRLAP